MASDELLIKIAADFSDVESGFQDNSKLWEKYNKDIASGEKAIKEYQDTFIKANQKVNDQLKKNITQISNEGKAAQKLQKDFENLAKKNVEAFDSKKLETFNKALAQVSNNMGSIENLNLNVDDFDKLLGLLSSTESDFEAVNVLVGFFEDKMKSAAVSVADSFETVKKKIDETKLNIGSTEDFIKSINKQIKTVAPGQAQANLISERDAATQALREEKVALADYQAQLKKAREENVSMTTQLRKVKDELVQLEIAGERGGDRWIELSQQAETYNDAIRSTNAELRRTSSSTEGLDNLIGAASGILGVFSAAEGATALFGNESEDLQKTLVKLNGAIALLNGLQAIQTELAKKETITARALTFVRGQYAIATDSSAKATIRLGAATKLLGIGLLVGALAAIVVYWKDIAEAIGLTNKATDSLNKINKVALDNAGKEIGRLKALEVELTNTNTPLNRQREIKNELLKQYPNYLKALGDEKSSAEDITKAFEELNKALILNAQIKASSEAIEDKFRQVLEARERLRRVEGLEIPNKAVKDAAIDQAKKQIAEAEADFEEFADRIGLTLAELNAELNSRGGDPTKDGDNFEKLKKEYQSLSDLLKELVDRQEEYRINAIENGREREKAILIERLESEKQAYEEEINALKVSEERKAKLRKEFDKLYNQQTGIAYEQLRKDLDNIDQKYDQELDAVKLKAISAIDAVFKTTEENDRKSIQNRYESIRKELLDQINKTNSVLEKANIAKLVFTLNKAENNDLKDFDLNTNLDRVDREKEIAEAILDIQQANARNTIKNEQLKQLQLLALEKNYLNNVISTYRDSFEDLQDQNLFQSLTDQLKNASDPEDIQNIADELREAFGDDVAQNILDVVAALKEVGNEISNLSQKSSFQTLIDDIGEWTSSLESFSRKLADTLGLQGQQAEEFAQSVATAIGTTYESLQTIFQLEIDDQRRKLDAIQESIDGVENELEREQQLYEDGYANNFEARQEDLENLKAQKRQEEEELKKAQKRKAQLAKAEFLIDTVSQLSNLITASTNIFKWASKIPIVGVPLAVGLIGTMFGAFAVAKSKAFQAIGQGGTSFRRGLHEGAVQLDGPSHERGGFGVYNSETGQKVAEFEGREKVYVLNATQNKRYSRLMDAMIEEERGGRKVKDSLMDMYNIPKLGTTTLNIVERANQNQVVANKSKQDRSQKSDKAFEEIAKLRDDFNREFQGSKQERKSKTETWETTHYFFVKKDGVTKKYKKKHHDN